MSNEKLNAKILEMQDDIIASIQQSIRIDSIKGEPEEGAPYGKGPKAALDDALALGERLGFKTGNVGNRVGWVEIGEGEEMVGVLGHLDVVPLGEGWIHPAFGAEIHDGVLYGRGVLDDKGPTIGAIWALKAIQDLGIKLDRRIRVLFGTDEENGSSCVHYYIDNGGELPTIGFTPDGEYPMIFFEKGASNFKVGKKNIEQGNVKVVSFAGGTAANVVTPKCRLVAEGDLDVKEAEGLTVTKEDGKTVIEAIGNGAHGSTPALGINAAVKLAEAVKHIEFGGDFQKMLNFILEELNGETNGAHMGILYQDEETGETTVNLGVVNFDEQELSMTLDIRYPKNGCADHVKECVLEAAKRQGLEAERTSFVPYLYIPQDSELVVKLMKVYREETGRNEKPLAIGGGTYAKAFKNMAAFGPMFPDTPACIHQPNECVPVDELMKSIQIIAAAMCELAQK